MNILANLKSILFPAAIGSATGGGAITTPSVTAPDFSALLAGATDSPAAPATIVPAGSNDSAQLSIDVLTAPMAPQPTNTSVPVTLGSSPTTAAPRAQSIASAAVPVEATAAPAVVPIDDAVADVDPNAPVTPNDYQPAPVQSESSLENILVAAPKNGPPARTGRATELKLTSLADAPHPDATPAQPVKAGPAPIVPVSQPRPSPSEIAPDAAPVAAAPMARPQPVTGTKAQAPLPLTLREPAVPTDAGAAPVAAEADLDSGDINEDRESILAKDDITPVAPPAVAVQSVAQSLSPAQPAASPAPSSATPITPSLAVASMAMTPLAPASADTAEPAPMLVGAGSDPVIPSPAAIAPTVAARPSKRAEMPVATAPVISASTVPIAQSGANMPAVTLPEPSERAPIGAPVFDQPAMPGGDAVEAPAPKHQALPVDNLRSSKPVPDLDQPGTSAPAIAISAMPGARPSAIGTDPVEPERAIASPPLPGMDQSRPIIATAPASALPISPLPDSTPSAITADPVAPLRPVSATIPAVSDSGIGQPVATPHELAAAPMGSAAPAVSKPGTEPVIVAPNSDMTPVASVRSAANAVPVPESTAPTADLMPTEPAAADLSTDQPPSMDAPAPKWAIRSEALTLLQLVRDRMTPGASSRESPVVPAHAGMARKQPASVTAITPLSDPAATVSLPAIGDNSAAPAPPSQPATVQSTSAPLSTSLAGQVVDMGISGQWIDGLARDIAGLSANGAQGRFQVNVDRLGPVQVDIRQGINGASVSMTVTTDDAEQALRQDSDRLRVDAGLAAVRIADIRIERATLIGEAARADNAGQQSTPQHAHQQSTQSQSQNASAQPQSGGATDAQQGMGQSSGQQRWQGRENFAADPKSGSAPAVLNHEGSSLPAGEAAQRDAGRARYA